jgi:Tol biopolymer transport system component
MQLYLIDAEGKAPAKLLPGQIPNRPYTNFACSPDGKHIAYCGPAAKE